MLAESRKTLACEHIQATAEAMPLANDSYDFLTMGFALRHVDDLEGAFMEYRRVLKPGGKVLILELTLPESRLARFFLKLYFKHILPAVVRLFTRSKEAAHMMWYYWDTMEMVVSPETVVQALRRAGLLKGRASGLDRSLQRDRPSGNRPRLGGRLEPAVPIGIFMSCSTDN